MKEAILIFSLGPVQSFIMQARKTRDLWLGSYLLSKLMEASMVGIDKLADDFVYFVFPAKRTIKDEETGRDDIPDLPNKYIAIFKTLEDAQDAAKQSKEQIADKWNEIRTDICKVIIQNNKNLKLEDKAVAEKIWNIQSNPDMFFVIVWVIVERKPDEEYKDWLDRAQKALDARKRLRDFLPQLEDEPGEKGTISGEREALHGVGSSRAEVRAFWTDLAKERSAKDIGQQGTERLDAIDTIKRFATEASAIPNRSFPSTSSVATASFVEKLLKAEIPETILHEWDVATSFELETTVPKAVPFLKAHAGMREWILYRDGDCYFPEAFTPRYLEENYKITINEKDKEKKPYLYLKDKDFIPNSLKALKELINAVGAHPIPYYAVIQMDGDNMGKLLSGVENREKHKKISEKLSEFSRKEVPKLVEEYRTGCLVYAGGDDVLAFSSLEGLLDAVNNLQEAYCKKIKEAELGAEREKKVTASIGIVIAHHFTPLSFVLRAAREAENLAKEHYGRNALVVTVIRHSGEQTRVGCQWNYEDVTDDEKLANEAQPIVLFDRFRDLFEKDIISPKCVHILLEEASSLVWLDRDIQASEIKRVLKRQRPDSKKDDLTDVTIQKLARYMSNLAAAMDKVMDKQHEKDKEFKKSTELHSEMPRFGLIEVLGWLLVMEFLARKGQD
jgi:CRISPR-associated protein Cmr2